MQRSSLRMRMGLDVCLVLPLAASCLSRAHVCIPQFLSDSSMICTSHQLTSPNRPPCTSKHPSHPLIGALPPGTVIQTNGHTSGSPQPQAMRPNLQSTICWIHKLQNACTSTRRRSSASESSQTSSTTMSLGHHIKPSRGSASRGSRRRRRILLL